MSSANDKNPTILIVNGANWLGARIIDTLVDNKGNVIVVDDFNESNIPFIKRFSSNKRFVFIERDKLNSIKESFTNIKYIIHLKHDFNSKDDDISSKQFLTETKFVDEVLTLALEKSSTYVLVSSLHLHKDFVLRKNFTRTGKNAYTESDLQDYIERTVLEYRHKAGLNSRIARIGNVYGPEMDLNKDSVLLQILSDAFYKDSIRVYGDGLEYLYYVYVTDAIQGVMRALFTPNTQGEIYSLTNPDEISVLSIVNKVLSFQPKAKKIKFLAGKSNNNPLYERAYIPDPNLSEIGWSPSVSFDRGLASVYEYFRKDLSLQDYTQKAATENSDADNEGLKFDFDNTLNLADSFYGQDHAEVEQFNDFYKKLNNPDSPIYNPTNKSETKTKNPLSAIQTTDVHAGGFFKKAFLLIFFVLLLSMIIVPGVRSTLFINDFKTKTNKLLQNTTDRTYQLRIYETAYEKESESILFADMWLINLIGEEPRYFQLKAGLRGIDESFLIYDKMWQDNLGNVIYSDESLNEANFVKLNNLSLQINSALSNLENFETLPLPDDIKSNVGEIKSWLLEVQEKVNQKTSATN